MLLFWSIKTYDNNEAQIIAQINRKLEYYYSAPIANHHREVILQKVMILFRAN